MEAVTWFDLAVGGLMLVSGLLALMRGFTREITSLVAWGVAGAAAVVAIFTPEIMKQAEVYISQPLLAKVAVGGGVFLIVLIILSLISIRFTDWLLDSAPGAFDRTLGFFYGLARGLALVVVAYLFYIWFIPEGSRFEAVRTARVLAPLETVSLKVIDLAVPGDIGDILRTKTYTYSRQNPAGKTITNGNTSAPKENSYNKGEKKVLDQLIENTQNAPKSNGNPTFGNNNQSQN